jgi:L-asparaginase/Glu-tRNA(Gln) amidotransferase subunit D
VVGKVNRSNRIRYQSEKLAMHIGILITHGTDTLAWTHAFLRYAVKNNHANIVLTGSQIPIPALGEFSDAYSNLDNSMRVLTCLKPPQLLTVFNYGEDVFSDSLRKIDRWDNVAFAGDRIARIKWGQIQEHDSQLELCDPHPLERLHLVTTGGTIEAEANEEGVLVPGENHVGSFIMRKFSAYFSDLSQDPVFAIDSSDLTFGRLQAIAETVVRCLQETNPDALADLGFDRGVRLIHLDPYKTPGECKHEVNNASGVVIAGYGGGNVMLNDGSGNGLLPWIRELTAREVPVVLSSQVPLGIADFLYDNGFQPLKAGAIPGVDLSLPECQVRLSYLLGHQEEIREAARRKGCSFLSLLEVLFVSGMKFRNTHSRNLYVRVKGLPVLADDVLVVHPMGDAIERASRAITAKQTAEKQ